MNRGLSLITAVASLIVLAGCTISGGGDGGVGDGPFPGETADTVSVQPDFEADPVRQNRTLSAGQSHLYEIDISSSVALNNDVVYFDAVPQDQDRTSGYLRVTAYTVTGNQAQPLYVSTTDQWFGHPDDPGLASLGADSRLETSAVGTAAPACGGPCVVVRTPASAGTAYVRVEGVQGFNTTYDFYVVATDFYDLSEPNDSTENAEAVAEFETGTIEVIGDTDWYVSEFAVDQVTFHGNPDLNLRANVYSLAGTYRGTLQDGETYFAPSTQRLRVEVLSDEAVERAAAAGSGIYSVEFQ